MDDREFGFERLTVWKRSVQFAGMVYRITKAFPREEVFGLTSQMRRAGVSVAANIAEGTSRTSCKDQARFFEIAYGSLNEIMTMLHIALGQGFVVEADFSACRSEILELCRMLSGLRRSAVGAAST